MALVAAAVVPHSPLLISSIAKHLAASSAATRAALLEVGQEIYAAQPDTVMVITPHGPRLEATAGLEVSEMLSGPLTEFGQLQTALHVPGAIALAHRFKEAAAAAHFPVVLQTNGAVDYGVTVPWLTMWPEPVPWSLLALTVPPLPLETALRCGDILRDFCLSRVERIALIASGDTDRRGAPMPDSARRPTPTERLFSDAIVQNDVSQLTPTSDTCLQTPLAILLGALQTLPATGRIVSFEVPVTIGQLVADFRLSA